MSDKKKGAGDGSANSLNIQENQPQGTSSSSENGHSAADTRGSNSATHWATKTLPTTVSKKKVLLIHCGDTVKRIAFTEKTNGDAIEKTIRRECGLSATDDFSLLDRELDSVVIDGSMIEGEVWLDIGSTGQMSKTKIRRPAQAAMTVLPTRPVPDFAELPIQDAIKHIFDSNKGEWSTSTCRVKIDTEAFGKGSLRKAYYMQDLSDPVGIYVAKASIDPDEDRQTYFQDVEMQLYAKKIAEKFNSYHPPKKIDFIQTWLITLPGKGNQIMAVEKFIDGPYRKHNNNYGYVNETERNTPQSFSHFSYEVTNHKALICDIQGVNDQYTDPQIHTADNVPGLGKGNLGSLGIEKFLQTHRCNAICRYLRLPLINAKIVDIGTKAEQTYMNMKHVEFVNVQFYPNEHNGLLKSEQVRLLSEAQQKPHPSRTCTFCSLV